MSTHVRTPTHQCLLANVGRKNVEARRAVPSPRHSSWAAPADTGTNPKLVPTGGTAVSSTVKNPSRATCCLSYFLRLYNYQCFERLEESSTLMKNCHSSLIYAKLGCYCHSDRLQIAAWTNELISSPEQMRPLLCCVIKLLWSLQSLLNLLVVASY